MKKIQHITAAIVTVLLLSACGESTGDRAISGAGIGAGVGAVSGAMIGGDPLTGAAIGGAVGAAAGGLTKSKNVNLGKPVWR
jgi:osmotically inducible lipoprotein OsmB